MKSLYNPLPYNWSLLSSITCSTYMTHVCRVAPVPIHHVFNLMGPNNQDSLLVDKFLSVSPSSACPSFLPSHIEDMDSMNIEQELKSSLFSKEDRDNTRTAEKTSVNEQYSTRCVGDKTDVDERSTDTTSQSYCWTRFCQQPTLVHSII